jgi:hypothetical protein
MSSFPVITMNYAGVGSATALVVTSSSTNGFTASGGLGATFNWIATLAQ